MFSRFLLLCLLGFSVANAQPDTSHLRISLLTVGPGHQEIYEPFGHTGVRIIDSIKGTDIVYNYGTFDGYEEGFELKFMQGKVVYYLSVAPFTGFIREYVETHRKVEEQVLILGGKEKQDIDAFLQNNLLPENRNYKYDFFYDNCATRIRDILPKTFGSRYQAGQTIPADAKISFRDIINRYLYKEHLYRFGINILLGSEIDKIMTNDDIMFLPDYLRDGIGGGNVDGQKVAGETVTILEGNAPPAPGVNWGFILTGVMLLLTMAGLFIKKLRPLGTFMSNLILFITGFLGCLILVMWLATDHQGCSDNFNLLWALPTNLIIAFLPKRNKDRYAVFALVLLVASLLLHVFAFQKLPLTEIWPLLLALVFSYGMICKKRFSNKTDGNKIRA